MEFKLTIDKQSDDKINELIYQIIGYLPIELYKWDQGFRRAVLALLVWKWFDILKLKVEFKLVRSLRYTLEKLLEGKPFEMWIYKATTLNDIALKFVNWRDQFKATLTTKHQLQEQTLIEKITLDRCNYNPF